MDIKKAINRIAWRFGANENKQPFPVNQNDIDAFNIISKTLKEHQEQQWRQNELFAKLYVYVYGRFIEKMGMTVMDTEPRKALNKILQLPLSHWIEEFKNKQNDSDLYAKFEKAGIDIKHPAFISEETRSENLEKAKTINFNQEVWDYETTLQMLEIEINNAINLNK